MKKVIDKLLKREEKKKLKNKGRMVVERLCSVFFIGKCSK